MLIKIKANGVSYFFNFLVGVIIYIAFLFSCAKQVPLTGGPKDTEHPKLVSALPNIGSTNFSQQKVVLKFNEFIKLNSLNQKLIISPPINPEPQIKLSGKSIKIFFDPNTLSENTTYLINFNDAIADINENNAINSFIYAFSTGNIIDSLMISGKVVDALSLKTAEDIWILLHTNLSDTAITSFKPEYITKTDKNGNFTVPFLKQNQYRLYALKDINFNYIYDLPNEMIAFYDSIITPTAVFDSASKKVIYQPSDIILRLFSSEKQLQSVKSSKRIYRNKIEFVFNKPLESFYSLKVIEDTNALIIPNKNKADSLIIWIQNEDLFEKNIETILQFRDPDFNDSLIIDTVVFRNPNKNFVITDFAPKVNKSKEPHQDLKLFFETPIKIIEKEKLKLKFRTDTVYINTKFEAKIDSLNPQNVIITTSFLEKTDYKILLEDGFCKNVYGDINTQAELSFTTISSAEYSNLKLFFADKDKQYIVQLLLSDKVIYEAISNEGTAIFEFLKPSKYRIRVIIDENKNGKWDTGDYTQLKQPEKVVFLQDEYELRANWNHELDWDIENRTNK